MKLYAIKSKKTGRYFRFEQYAEDGWGKYEDCINVKDNGIFYADDLPSFFYRDIFSCPITHYNFKDHEKWELEVVEFDLSKTNCKKPAKLGEIE